MSELESIDALIEASINGLWMGLVLTASVGCLLLLMRQTNAATRYLIWWTTLLIVVSLPPLALWTPPTLSMTLIDSSIETDKGNGLNETFSSSPSGCGGGRSWDGSYGFGSGPA